MLQPEDGGVAEHVLLLSTGLARRGWGVEVACSATNAIRPALVEAGVPVHTVPLARRPGVDDLRAARALRALDRRQRFDVVHGHSSKAGALVRAVLPDRLRLVYTPNCLPFASGVAGRAERILYRAVEQALVPRTAAMVAVADWERRLAERALRGSQGRIRVIHNGVRPFPQAEPAQELLEFKGDRPLAGLVAVLRPQKDPVAAVEAAALVRRRGALDFRLAIVGNGWLEDEVRRAIDAHGVSDAVRWFPFEGEVGRYLLALDLFVLPSRWEALPLAIGEAMSCGLPVLATPVGGTPEMVEDGVNGRLVPPGDTTALADALEQLLSRPDELRRMGAEGDRVARERFGADRMVNATEALYRDLIGEGRPSG